MFLASFDAKHNLLNNALHPSIFDSIFSNTLEKNLTRHPRVTGAFDHTSSDS